MRRTLSSQITFFWKTIFPTLWLGVMGLGSLLVLFGSEDGRPGAPDRLSVFCTFVFCYLFGVVFLYWTCIRLKAVAIDDEALYVSNYLAEERVPLTEVVAVEQDKLLNSHPITVRFRHPTRFGRSVVFMPRMALFARDADEVRAIRAAVAVAWSNASAPPRAPRRGASSDGIATDDGVNALAGRPPGITKQEPGAIQDGNGGA